ncbi:CLUMA_CG005403, isoform A [Clunio marinus]|uniref:CLUMA_CG005403, isoform A n=1 Tax=Clunio marinus TaxID=568069 RepID=A0A1J1HUU3_9DIPT|nr:CLUMA_CG005403, isoform A [Clunio marinus]
MSADLNTNDIEKLTGEENYYPWSLQIEAVLTDLDLWVDIDKKNYSNAELEIAKKSLRKIVYSISQNVLASVAPLLKENNGIQLLRILREKFFHGAAITKVKLVYEAFKPISSGSSLRELRNHIDDIRSKFHILTLMGSQLPEHVKVACLLRSVPENLATSILTYHSKKEEDLNFENGVKIIIAECERRNFEKNNNFMETTLASVFKPKNRAWRMTHLYCTACNRKGHLTELCWNENKTSNNKKAQNLQNPCKRSHVAEISDDEPKKFRHDFAATSEAHHESFTTKKSFENEVSVFKLLEAQRNLSSAAQAAYTSNQSNVIALLNINDGKNVGEMSENLNVTEHNRFKSPIPNIDENTKVKMDLEKASKIVPTLIKSSD